MQCDRLEKGSILRRVRLHSSWSGNATRYTLTLRSIFESVFNKGLHVIDELFFLRIPAILVALTIHEFAHGWVAYRMGDNTASDAGRLTFNPMAHLDPFGALMLMFGPFGWARPVPVNVYNLRDPKKGIFWVSAAGPLSNILLAVVVGLLVRFTGVLDMLPGSSSANYFKQFLFILVTLNLGIAFFNLLPIPPLDGSKILMSLLPGRQAQGYMRFAARAPQVFLILIMVEWVLNIPTISLVLGPLFRPFLGFWLGLIFGPTGI